MKKSIWLGTERCMETDMSEQMSVKLVSVTTGAGDLVNKTAQEIISYTARVSNPSNQNNMETAPKLLAYLIKNKHWSPFEMAHMTVEITTSRAIAQQILRHRSFSFQEFCISGDSLITIIQPNGTPNYHSIKKLYERQNWKRYKRLKARVYDELRGQFTTASIKEIFNTGKKECFKVYLEDGKTITTTKDHKFLTKEGFIPLEMALGLTLNNKTVSLENPKELAINGTLAYQDFEWMKAAKERSILLKTGVQGIADEAGVSYHTIRKWLKLLNLKFTKKEVAAMYDVWNKGKTGYQISKWSEEDKIEKRNRTPKGPAHHSYKGGKAAERRAIANFFTPIRKDILKKFNYTCQMCSQPLNTFDGKVDLHHIKEVGLYPELAYDIENIIPVHRKCHMEHHGKSYYFKSIKRGKRTLIPKFKRVVKVEYVGPIDTYDMEVDHPSHNYVANKFCVHNSQRYSIVTDHIVYDARRQDTKNRQNSIDDMSEEDKEWFKQAQENTIAFSKIYYEEALKKGIAKEQARFLLPLNTQTRMYMSGSVRSWIHYLDLRCLNGTQLEHKEIADAIKKIFNEQFPDISTAMGWNI